jgi:hypothetical protein
LRFGGLQSTAAPPQHSDAILVAVQEDGRALWGEDRVGFDVVDSPVEVIPARMENRKSQPVLKHIVGRVRESRRRTYIVHSGQSAAPEASSGLSSRLQYVFALSDLTGTKEALKVPRREEVQRRSRRIERREALAATKLLVEGVAFCVERYQRIISSQRQSTKTKDSLRSVVPVVKGAGCVE